MHGSIAIGVGNNADSLSTDQRGAGHPRTMSNQGTDIGAFEFDAILWTKFDE